jgi:hypothetical protein
MPPIHGVLRRLKQKLVSAWLNVRPRRGRNADHYDLFEWNDMTTTVLIELKGRKLVAF